MAERRRRSVFEAGHRRKFLVVVDETPEVESALAYAANRAKRTGGSVKLLYVIAPSEMTGEWLGVQEVYLEEQQNKAKAVFRLAARKLKTYGVDEAAIEDVIREGNKSEQILKLIEEDQDIADPGARCLDRSGRTGPPRHLARHRQARRQFPDPDHHRAGQPDAGRDRGVGLTVLGNKTIDA